MLHRQQATGEDRSVNRVRTPVVSSMTGRIQEFLRARHRVSTWEDFREHFLEEAGFKQRPEAWLGEPSEGG